MSWIIAFSGSAGSSSPNARPAMVSNCPALPKLAPPNAGEVFVSTTKRTTRADADVASARERSKASAIALGEGIGASMGTDRILFLDFCSDELEVGGRLLFGSDTKSMPAL